MSDTAKEDKSYSVEDLLPGKDLNFGSSRVVFSHQASAGDKSIDLNNLVTPPDMAANGFNQALAGEIESAHLSILRNSLTLVSTRGPLTQFLDYVVSETGTINFLSSSILGVEGALEGEIFTGVISEKKANSIVVGDVKEYDVTLDDTNFTPGDTVLNVGVEYNVNENSLNQTGEMRVYKNGKRIYRNVGNAAADPSADGNYQEIDAGTGKGTTIELNEPAQAGDIFGFDFGIKISSGDVQIFGELERLQGSFLKLVEDAAPAFGNPITDYFTANPSEIERRAFGDLVQKLAKILDAKVLDRVNVFGAYINLNATIGTQSTDENGIPWIDSVSSGGTGIYNITYTSNFFGPDFTPAIIGSPNSTANRSLTFVSQSVSGCQVRITDGLSSSNLENLPFNLVAIRCSDQKLPRTISDILGL